MLKADSEIKNCEFWTQIRLKLAILTNYFLGYLTYLMFVYYLSSCYKVSKRSLEWILRYQDSKCLAKNQAKAPFAPNQNFWGHLTYIIFVSLLPFIILQGFKKTIIKLIPRYKVASKQNFLGHFTYAFLSTY